MAKLLKILHYPNPILSLKASPINKITSEIKTLAEDMLYTMEKSNGIGLAANQVGILSQIIVVNIDDIEPEHLKSLMPLVLINPQIIYKSKEVIEFEEGCLSFPELRVTTHRSNKVKVKYLNLNGEEKIIEATDLLSICLQHEIDHLNGFLFINKVSSLKRDLLLRKYKKLQFVKSQ